MSVSPAESSQHFFVYLPVIDTCKEKYTTEWYQSYSLNQKMVVFQGIADNHTVQVIAPDELKAKWSSFNFKNVVECTGPVRNLDRNEWIELVKNLRPDLPLPGKFNK